MLKALELIGFKSFADRTRFEFPPGITVIVGPNGSGKSNVVDAIKWVLGEQSVKSLRGKEMADVIFNGSGTRGVQNTAEATLVFENRDGLLAIDAPEVHITRRVYRSGEGEYLINRQICRLRDIREHFSGTGAATEAYSVIEQGKVDILLQSSSRDRRAIFEEAAGISRFKAKKIESLRRLERVEQNLLRLADIVDEVDNQLRSVRKQAGKAQRFREYSDRLKSLRLAAASADWRRLTAQIDQRQQHLTSLRDQVRTASEQYAGQENSAQEAERALADLTQQLRDADAQAAECRQAIASQEATCDHERSRLNDLEQEREDHRGRYLGLSARAGDIELEWRATVAQLEEAEKRGARLERQLADEQQAADQLQAQLEALRKTADARRAAYMNLMRSAAAKSSQITVGEEQQSAAYGAWQRADRQLTEIEAQLRAHSEDVERRRGELNEAAGMLEQRQSAAAELQTLLVETARQQERALNELATLREQQSAARERAALLKELEDRFEGISVGAQEILLSARQSSDGPLANVKGLVADLLHATVEMAPLIDLALGAAAQYLVVSDRAGLLDFLNRQSGGFSGRVGFVCFDPLPVPANDAIGGQLGVIRRADQCVEDAAEIPGLAKQLLGQTWIVDTLDHAVEISRTMAADLQLVTLAGEVVGPGGFISAGPRQASAGLVSRRSELRSLNQQLEALEDSVRRKEADAAALKQQLADQNARLELRMAEQLEAQHAVAELKAQLKALSIRETQWQKQRAGLAAERDEAARSRRQTEVTVAKLREELKAIEGELSAGDDEIGRTTSELESLEAQRRSWNQQLTALEVQQAKSDELISRLRLEIAQLTDSQQERRRVLADHAQQLSRRNERVAATVRSILKAESALAELYLQKERLDGQCRSLRERQDALQNRRAAAGQMMQQLLADIRQREEEIHVEALACREVELELDAISLRLKDDYQIELATVVAPTDDDDPRPREEINAEIDELRRKIHHIGSVNLDALAELDALEARHGHLSSQYQDLADAKNTLEQIIGRINGDSRRLLAETFETVRGHFRELFVKLFGGGHADILLEESVDILESGVEIVARPPGKEPRSISLLSGGEKTLTCVALLLAIFRSRPSPFCVLDEVDAALDESNIERFIGVLKEFLSFTQFIIITHSKKTMTCANTLYGVTMQESGVSKRVAVRFEDVSETGEILAPAARFEADETQAA